MEARGIKVMHAHLRALGQVANLDPKAKKSARTIKLGEACLKRIVLVLFGEQTLRQEQ